MFDILIKNGKIAKISSNLKEEDAKEIKVLESYQALDEMFEINRQTNVHVHISHLKLSGKSQWGRQRN